MNAIVKMLQNKTAVNENTKRFNPMVYVRRDIIIPAVIVLFAVWVRNMYHHYNPVYNIYSDTAQYVQRANEILQGQPLIHPFRYPLFPLLISMTVAPRSGEKITMDNIGRFDFNVLVRLNRYAGLIGVAISVLLIYMVIPSKIFAGILSLLIAVNINWYGFEKNILTETFGSLGLLFAVYSFGKYIHTQRSIYCIVSVLTGGILFLLHPTYVFVPFMLLPAALPFFLKTGKTSSIRTLLLLNLLYSLLPMTYVLLNSTLYGFSGISGITNQNLLAKSIMYKLDASAVPDDEYYTRFKSCIDVYRGEPDLDIAACFRPFLKEHDFQDIQLNSKAGNFAVQTIGRNFPVYMGKSLVLFPHYLMSVAPDPVMWISVYSTNNIISGIWDILHRFFNLLETSYVSFLIIFPYHLFRTLRNPSKTNIILLLIGNIIFCNIVSGTFLSFTNYIRLRTPVEPLLLAFCLYYYTRLFSFLGMKTWRITKMHV